MLRSTDAAIGATRFYRVEETHALPANVPLTIMEMRYGRASPKAQVFIKHSGAGLIIMYLRELGQ